MDPIGLGASIYGWHMEWGGTFPQNVQAALRLVENEKMGLFQNVQSALRLAENQNNTFGPPLYDKM